MLWGMLLRRSVGGSGSLVEAQLERIIPSAGRVRVTAIKWKMRFIVSGKSLRQNRNNSNYGADVSKITLSPG